MVKHKLDLSIDEVAAELKKQFKREDKVRRKKERVSKLHNEYVKVLNLASLVIPPDVFATYRKRDVSDYGVRDLTVGIDTIRNLMKLYIERNRKVMPDDSDSESEGDLTDVAISVESADEVLTKTGNSTNNNK